MKFLIDAVYLFQENLPPANSRDESQEPRRKRNSRDNNSQERLTEKSTTTEKPSIDLTSSIVDCCCIGPRSRLPLPRISSAVSATSATSSVVTVPSSRTSSCPAPIASGGYLSPGGTVIGATTVAAGGGYCSPPLPASLMGVGETTPTIANNSRGAVQPSVGNIGSTSQQQHHQQYHHQHYPQTTAAVATSSYSSPTTTTTTPSSSTSHGYSSGVSTTTQSAISVPRQLAQWTKHQTLKLQVLDSINRATRLIDHSVFSSFSSFTLCRS